MRKLIALFVVVGFSTLASATISAQNKTVGADKCAKVCHKVQFQSWSETAHAKPGAKMADCEKCHGPGSAYMTMSIMKDPAKAKAMGLIARPARTSCNECHKPGEITDAMMAKVHAHKPKA